MAEVVVVEAHKTKITEGHHLPKQTMTYGYGSAASHRNASTLLAVFLLLVGIIALIIWLVYRPHNPQFTVVGASVYDINTTTPSFITTTMQFTVVTRNSNRRTSIYYDHLSAFVVYRNQPITAPLALPPLYHEEKSTVAMSPILSGSCVPVSRDISNGMIMDQTYGAVSLRLVIMGRLRWKGGAFKSGRHRVYIRCDMLVGLKKGYVGQVPLLGSPDCDVDI